MASCLMMACTAGRVPLVPRRCFDWNTYGYGPRQERARMELDVIVKYSVVGINCGRDVHTSARGGCVCVTSLGQEWVR
jgi:hypothetical protein